MNRHELRIDEERGALRASCVCGWVSLGLDKTPRAASQSFSAHMYATGHRTAEQIKTATGGAS